MWEANYGKEPFDLRLTVLRMFRRLGLILGVTFVGTVLFGGGYYVKNVLMQTEPVYGASSTYHIVYETGGEKDITKLYINEVTWNYYFGTQLFLEEVRQYLPVGHSYTDAELTEALNAVVPSDLRTFVITAYTQSKEQSLEIAGAVESALVHDFPAQIYEISSISLIDSAREAERVYPDVRPLRAVILSALLSFFFAVVIVLLKEIGDDSIWLPSTLGKRYGLKAVGTLASPELAENIRYLFREKKRIAVCPVQDRVDPAQVLEKLREACGELESLWKEQEWLPAPSPLLCPENCRTLRDVEGILLVLAAGRHGGKQLEYTMEFLKQQDCEITGVLLWDADELLLSVYYGFGHRREKAYEG